MRAIALAFSAKILPRKGQKSQKVLPNGAIKGMNASYDPRFYFISKGAIYLRAGFEEAYKNGFNYKFVDIVRDF
ncbi:hypothetical protein LS71_008900 [Helicobacter jaachi]|uniref:Uncharacterized protein n=1 Tax=Helicobacter jaachi TaxID=1677920 RepID=A0A4U8T5S2_9HELI|nr:hypothetical protein [Helicobacter jaachi]TLD94929.1 hypothetical protein LS71_008900 [Helicobacter jaachi]